MVYKKYIKRNGKLYGPYYYKNIRVDGKIKNVCLGRTLPKGERIEGRITKPKLNIQKKVSKRRNVKKVKDIVKSKKTGLVGQKIGVTKNIPILEKELSESVEGRNGSINFYYNNQFKITIVLSVLMIMFFTFSSLIVYLWSFRIYEDRKAAFLAGLMMSACEWLIADSLHGLDTTTCICFSLLTFYLFHVYNKGKGL